MTEDHQFNDRARAWIEAIHGQYVAGPVPVATAPLAATLADVGHFKIL